MPRHTQVTTCLRGGGPISKSCTCEHCNLSVCSICGAYEGGLTTDCPGSKVDHDRQKEVFETSLDYTDDRGWHLSATKKTPRFETDELPQPPQRVDSRAIVAPSIDWTTVDRNAALQHELAQRGAAWVLADRICEEHAAALTRLEDEIDSLLPKGSAPSEHVQDLLKKLEREKIHFQLANQLEDLCDDEFRQAARRLVAALEDARGEDP